MAVQYYINVINKIWHLKTFINVFKHEPLTPKSELQDYKL